MPPPAAISTQTRSQSTRTNIHSASNPTSTKTPPPPRATTALINTLSSSTPIIGESGPFRYSPKPGFPLKNVLPYCHPDIDASTISSMFQYAARVHGSKQCLAYRTVVGRAEQTVRQVEVKYTEEGEYYEVEGEPKLQVKTMLSDWNWWTYEEVTVANKRLAAGMICMLREMGVTRLEDRDAPWGTMYMFADSSPQWFMMAHAAGMMGMPVVGVNIRLGEAEFIYTVNESAPTVLFTDARSLPTFLTPLVECPSIKLIVYFINSSIEEDLERCRADVETIEIALLGSVAVQSFDDVLEKGQMYLLTHDDVMVKDPERVWSITYPQSHLHRKPPKSVVHQEKQIIATVAALALQMDGQWKNDERYLTHLPLYSILEFAFVHAVLFAGYPVGFATQEAKFLLSSPFDNGVLHPDFKGDFNSFNPTITYGIMPWWSIIVDIIHNDILGEKTEREREQFWQWYNRKKFLLQNKLDFSTALQFAEKKAGIDVIRRRLFGNKMRWIGNYCSRMPKEKREFLGLVLGGEKGIMVEGFMIQELNTIVTFMTPRTHDPINGLGRPMPSLEIKLKHHKGHVKEADGCIYGTICIRGPSVPLTADIGPDGWTTTAFYGKWHIQARHLQIIRTFRDLRDRYLGDYIPVGDLERILAKAPFVESGILVYQGQRLELIGVLSIKESALRTFVQETYNHAHEDLTLDEIMMLSDLKSRIVKFLRQLQREHGCAGFELVDKVVMIGGSFTRANGLLNANGELDRKRIMEAYRDEILYEAS
ncbi:acetyl-CoA synthetase-like protein [Ascodesmis nigricans]|uniref:Acetyl-CoA synthetase-like protein n=1 Tax=Ascodesmis nigricans TaxID=341454 RepID=A0A4S2N0Z3_9PEZI|nr:acetyl-CoA synthetase-like protein [Ascodesmis nigricans]